LTFPAFTASATWSIPIFRAASCRGSSWIRTAYFWEPNTCTWATPGTVEMRCDRNVSPYSSSTDSGSVCEVRAK